MKKQIIVCTVFLSTFVNLSVAQQTKAMEQRVLSPSQLFTKHQGQYESFKSLVVRFEVAWQELDAQSMADLKEVLAKMMTEYNADSHPTAETEAKLLERAQQKSAIRLALDKLPIAANDNALGPKAEQVQQNLQQFLRLMEADILEHYKTLEP